MAAQVHTGANVANNPGFRFDNIGISPQSTPFTGDECIHPGLRQAGSGVISPINGTDVAERGVGYQHEVKLTLPTYQCKPLFLRNYTQLSRILVDAKMRGIGGGSSSMGWWTFINNAADLGVQATGTTSLAFGYKFMLNSTEATATITMNSYLTSLLSTDELWFLFSSSGAALAANTGGTTQGLTPESYVVSSKTIPIWDHIVVTNSGGTAQPGRLGMSTEFSFETFAGEPDTRNRGTAQGVKVDSKLRIIDLNKTQAQAFLTDFAEDCTYTLYDKSGYSYVMQNGAVSGMPEYRLSEKPKDSWVEVSVSGAIPMNPGGITDTTYMDMGTTDPKQIVFKLAGYSD